MSDHQIAIFCFGLASGFLIAAFDVLLGAGMDRRLLVSLLAIGAIGAGTLGLLHVSKRKAP